jgi:DnaJ-class molecular chaperone
MTSPAAKERRRQQNAVYKAAYGVDLEHHRNFLRWLDRQDGPGYEMYAMKCDSCDGTGHRRNVRRGVTEICPRCRGKGERLGPEYCPQCHQVLPHFFDKCLG